MLFGLLSHLRYLLVNVETALFAVVFRHIDPSLLCLLVSCIIIISLEYRLRISGVIRFFVVHDANVASVAAVSVTINPCLNRPLCTLLITLRAKLRSVL